MTNWKVEPDEFMLAAGQCFMYLLWCETVMRDFVVLREGGADMRRRYSEALGKQPHPSDFSRRRMEMGKHDLVCVKDRYLALWPELRDDPETLDTIERIVVWRNALGHANVQPFRGSLLYTPRGDNAWERIRNHTRCADCFQYHKDCTCQPEDLADPPSILIREETLQAIYDDIRAADIECFFPVAVHMNIEYRGIAWPMPDGEFLIVENHALSR